MAKTQYEESEHEIELGPDYGDVSVAVEDDEDLTFKITGLGEVVVQMNHTGPGKDRDTWTIGGEFDHEGLHKYLDGTYNALTRKGKVKVFTPTP